MRLVDESPPASSLSLPICKLVTPSPHMLAYKDSIRSRESQLGLGSGQAQPALCMGQSWCKGQGVGTAKIARQGRGAQPLPQGTWESSRGSQRYYSQGGTGVSLLRTL